jgi:D-hexose-6-phosphate mutarotase
MTSPTAARTDLPAGIRAVEAHGSLPAIAVSLPSATALIYLHGAHVAEWRPTDQLPVLWMSAHSRYGATDALRGGIPLCFPWFGQNASDPTLPNHGWARLAEWTLLSATSGADVAELTFELTDESVGVPAGTAPMRLLYVVTVGATLTVDLQVVNTGDADLTFDEAFHTYLAVADVTATSIHGVANLPFIDRTVTPDATAVSAEPMGFVGDQVDRIYPMPSAIDVDDTGNSRVITVAAKASAQSVIWNPGRAKAAGIADFGDDEWASMVCVEAVNIRDHAITLAPGASHRLHTEITAAQR